MTNTALLINIIFGFITIPANYFIKLPFYSFLTLILTVLLFLVLYYFSRFKKKAEICVDIAISYTFLVFTPVMWFSNNGLEGGFQFYIFLFGAFTLAVVEGKKLLFFLLMLFTISISLIIIGYIYPELVTQYPTKTDKFIDMFISFILVFIGILFLMYYYTKQFYKYNKKLNDTNIKLEGVNIQLSGRIKEREVLLHEIHHRVKNNLQMVSGLLRLQCNASNNSDLCKLLQISQERINTISSVHELLYRSDNLKSIDIKEYINSLANNIKISSYTDKRNIIINTDLQNSIIEINKIIPCGLIINELLSNSIKHAFDINGGIINIKGESKNKEYIIYISDNGKGLSENFEIKKLNSLGFKLILGLTDQINGDFKFNRLEKGVEFILNFKAS